jgi:UDP-N-acetylglucosamine kinase
VPVRPVCRLPAGRQDRQAVEEPGDSIDFFVWESKIQWKSKFKSTYCMHKLTPEESKKQEEAVSFIKNNKQTLIKKFANAEIYTPRNEPITIFMAGVPGAGKTEVSKRLIEELNTKPVRIDADDMRELFRDIGYDGKNSYIFQKACSHGVDKLFDHAQMKRLHTIVDGTFSSENSIRNVGRAIGRERKVFIYYIYQDPIIAWKAAKGRELEEGRYIPKEAFVRAYAKSRENVNKAKEIYANAIKLNVIIKNAEYNLEKQHLNINNVDSYINKIYTDNELDEAIL